jgi:hypothetical protein
MANNKKNIKKEISRSFIAKDFDSMRIDLQKFARTYYPDNMQDFSEASLGGLLVDLAAYVGDTMSYYTDHQFRELDPISAVETSNIERMAQNAGIKIGGASPAVAEVDFYIRVPAVEENGVLKPQLNALPIIKAGTVVSSTIGVKFYLIENIDFSLTDSVGNLVARKIKIKRRQGLDSFVLVLPGTCVSGTLVTETFTLTNSFVPFRTIKLQNPDVSTILSVTDSADNEYYEVESLSQDTVFKSFQNNNKTDDGVESNLSVIPAPYRFITTTDIRTRRTGIQFGSGRSDNTADDGVPDPSDLSLPLYGKKTMPRFSLDPAALLDTKTLGISPQNTTINVTYRYGGGAAHNVSSKSINQLDVLEIEFKDSLNGITALETRASIEVLNEQPAAGGANRISTEEIRQLIPTARNLQSRVVTRDDLLARLYLLPNEYGRIFRAGIVANPQNPLASILYVISRDASGRLSQSPDVLKKNISKYLNEYRMISDAIDILDARVFNFRVNVSIVTAPNVNKTQVTKKVLTAIKKLFKLEKSQIDKPIIESDIVFAIINVPGVLSLVELNLSSLYGTIAKRTYSESQLDFDNAKNNGIYFPPSGGIFELRYPNDDIMITVR